MGDTVKITSTSNRSAVSDPILVRSKDTTRLLFLPEIVDNPKVPKAAVKGTFVYQRRDKKNQWEKVDSINLSSLRGGEGVKLKLSSSELLAFLQGVAKLYNIRKKEGGVPSGISEYIKVSEPEKELLKLGDDKLRLLLKTGEGKKFLTRMLSLLSSESADLDVLDSLTSLREFGTGELNTVVRLASLVDLVSLWKKEADNSDEEFWQGEFAKRPFVFSMLFPYAVIIVDEKAYLGGKDLTNKGGNIADFLCERSLTGNCLVVELKTPLTKVLGKKYRGNAFSLSSDLSGAVVQTQNYLSSFVSEGKALVGFERTLNSLYPRGLIIAGNSSEFADDPTKQKSFDLFRNSQERLEILTYDEVFDKAQKLIDILRSEQ